MSVHLHVFAYVYVAASEIILAVRNRQPAGWESCRSVTLLRTNGATRKFQSASEGNGVHLDVTNYPLFTTMVSKDHKSQKSIINHNQ